jgi:Phage major capsid protein E
MDLGTILRQLEASQDFYTLANTPVIQFGRPSAPLLGPTVLPERRVDLNEWTEQSIRYRTFIANDGTRYSPAQMRPSGMITGSMFVSLGNQDVAAQLTSKDYDALLRHLRSNATMEVIANSILQWTDNAIVQPMVRLQEKQRWDALVTAQVVRVGDNGYREVVTYPNPIGSRAAAGGAWSNNTYDPFDDIYAHVDALTALGYTASRFITSRRVLTILQKNDIVQKRAAGVRYVSPTETIIGRVTAADVNAALGADGLPGIETYDQVYFDLAGTHRFIPDSVFMILAMTGSDETIQYPQGEPRVVENILGYSAVGTAAGQNNPGRVVMMEAKNDKPPRIESQGWQSTLPVLMEPEAIRIVTGIA